MKYLKYLVIAALLFSGFSAEAMRIDNPIIKGPLYASSTGMFDGKLTINATTSSTALELTGSNTGILFQDGTYQFSARSTTTDDYWLGLFDKGYFYSSTSADYWYSSADRFSTTSVDAWEATQTRYSDTDTNAYIHSSTTIPKTYTENTFSNTNTFSGNTYFPSGIWNTSGYIAIGTTSPSFAIDIVGTSLATAGVRSTRYSDSIFSSTLRIAKGRGSEGSPSDVQVEDILFRTEAQGYKDGSFTTAAGMDYIVSSVDTGIVSGSIRFNTDDSAGNWGERMRITGDGRVGIGTTTPNSLFGVYNLIDFVNNNEFIGPNAGEYVRGVSGANYNTFLGYQTGRGKSGNVTTNTDQNVGIGASVLSNITSGGSNTGVGAFSLLNTSSGNGNVAIGHTALEDVTTGSYNVGIGYRAGSFETGDYSIYIDNRNRSNTAGDKAGAPFYAVTNATPASQTIQLNGKVGILGAASSFLTLPAGTASAGTAPLKFTSGTVNSSAEAGAMEFNGTNFFLTPASTRKQIPITNVAIPSNGQIPIGNGTDYTIAAPTGVSNQTAVTTGAGTLQFSLASYSYVSSSFYAGGAGAWAGAGWALRGAASGAVSFGVSSGATTMTADRSGAKLMVAPGSFAEAASGNHPMLASAAIRPVTVVGAAATVSDTATFYVEGPISATVTGQNYAAWFDDGIVAVDYRLAIGTTSPATLLDVFSTGTSTITIDSNSATQGSCLKLKDFDGGGYTYITVQDGSLIASTDSCE